MFPRRLGERPPIGAALLATALAGCLISARPSPAPPAWRVTHAQAQTSVLGAWAALSLQNGQTLSGELLAVSYDSLFLGASPRFYRVRIPCIDRIRVAGYESDDSGPLAWGILLSLTTLSHGWFFPLTLPAVGLVGSIVRIAQGGAGHLEETARAGIRLERLAPWARYPQGIPIDFVLHRAYLELNEVCAWVGATPRSP